MNDCLAPTGSPTDALALVAAIAVVFIVGGVIALRRTKGRAALLLLPLLLVGLFFAVPSAPASAACPTPTPTPTEVCEPIDPIPGANIDGWDEVEIEGTGLFVSDEPSDAIQARIVELTSLATNIQVIPSIQSNLGDSPTEGPTYNAPGIIPTVDINGIVRLDQEQVYERLFQLRDEELLNLGDANVMVFVVFTYDDGCGGELSTTILYEGLVFFGIN